MPEQKANKDPAEDFRAQLESGDFLGAISGLRNRIAPLKIYVIQAAERRRKLEALCARRNRVSDNLNRLLAEPTKQDEDVSVQRNKRMLACQRKIKAYDGAIKEFWSNDTRRGILQEFLVQVGDSLGYMPSNEPRFKQIAEHIERLRLWPEGYADGSRGSNEPPSLYPSYSFEHVGLSANEIVAELSQLDYRFGELLSLGILEGTESSLVRNIQEPPVDSGNVDRQKLYEEWKQRNPKRGALTTLLGRLDVDESDFGKWRRRKKFKEDSAVTRRLIEALSH